ncbi:MAG: toll/interleukin-1 receptor domain-containing protein [Planctomyces sp.]|nr:toll/interleukin-1 receptor domain-containing protein [Planctomyces sp.]
MIATRQQTVDVFLSFSAAESALAGRVADQLRAHGLVVFDEDRLEERAHIEDAMWDAVAECRAVVAIVSRDAPTSRMTFEIGAALAWRKPVFAIASDWSLTRVNPLLAQASVYSPDRIDDVARAVRSIRDLSARDRRVLAGACRATAGSVDQLIADPVLLDSLEARYQARTGQFVPAERLLSELLRMRKQGLLKTSGRDRKAPGRPADEP